MKPSGVHGLVALADWFVWVIRVVILSMEFKNSRTGRFRVDQPRVTKWMGSKMDKLGAIEWSPKLSYDEKATKREIYPANSLKKFWIISVITVTFSPIITQIKYQTIIGVPTFMYTTFIWMLHKKCMFTYVNMNAYLITQHLYHPILFICHIKYSFIASCALCSYTLHPDYFTCECCICRFILKLLVLFL